MMTKKQVKNDEYHIINASHIVDDENLETSSIQLRFIALDEVGRKFKMINNEFFLKTNDDNKHYFEEIIIIFE